MGQVKGRAGDIPIVAFSCDDSPQYVKALKEISRHQRIVFREEVARSVTQTEKSEATVKATDQHHWSEVGHRIVGNVVADYLRKSVMPSVTASNPAAVHLLASVSRERSPHLLTGILRGVPCAAAQRTIVVGTRVHSVPPLSGD